MATDCGRPGRATGRFLVREATVEDIPGLVLRLSIEDAAECYAMHGLRLDEAVSYFYSQSDYVEAVVDTETDQVVAMGGVEGHDGAPAADVWLLCDRAVAADARHFIRALRDRIDEWSDHYGLLYGYIDDRAALRKRWLQALGFRLTDTVTDEFFYSLPFRLFVYDPTE